MANEKRLIDANELLIDAEDYAPIRGGLADMYDIKWLVDAQITEDAEPVVHGRWEQMQRWATKAKYRCSVCGREIMSATKVNIEKYPYCHCGAKMDGERKDNEN